MRTKNAFKNLFLYLLYEIVFFSVSIIFPRFIILQYGSEVNGLTSTISRVLSLINLIQAGAVGAAVFQMYKPVADNDFDTQSAIIYSSKKFYKKIAVLYLSLAIGVGLFYSFYLQSETLIWWEILLSFLILAINGTCVLLVTSICNIYLSSHQKMYYLIISQFANLIFHYGFLTVALLFKLHFIFIYVSLLLGGVINILLNYLFFKKESKGKIVKTPSNQNYAIPDKKYLMLQSVANEATTAAPTIIISTILGLAYSSVFSIYFMIFASMKTILNAIQLSVSAIFGNVVKTSDEKKIYEIYDFVEMITILLGTVASVCVAFLVMPFIEIYTKGVTDVEYSYRLLGLSTTIFVLLFAFKTSFAYVSTVYGLFKKTCFITLTSAGIGILITIVLVLLFGLPYSMIGLLVNEIGASIAILIVLKKEISWFSLRKLFIRTGIMILLSVCSSICYYLINPQISSFSTWIIYALIVAASTIMVLLIYCLFFEKKQIRNFVTYTKMIFRKEP